MQLSNEKDAYHEYLLSGGLGVGFCEAWMEPDKCHRMCDLTCNMSIIQAIARRKSVSVICS